MEFIKLKKNEEDELKKEYILSINNNVHDKSKKILYGQINQKECLKYFIYIIFLTMGLFILIFIIEIIVNIQSIIELDIFQLVKINIEETNQDKNDKNEEFKGEKEDTYINEVFSSREHSFEKARDFLDKCMKGILLQKVPLNESENPKVSIVIPVYNSKNLINRAIKSIQNQNNIELEIILVNDYSTDDTLSYIQEIQEEDPRIKIINNKKNMGIIYSRSIGTLSAKGKYIFPLDNDDMFLDKDVFEIITNIAEKGDFDIVEFKGIISLLENRGELYNTRIDTSYSSHPLNLVLYQPELGRFQIQPGKTLDTYHIETVFLWGKCIRTNIYQKAINRIGEKRYTRFMIRYEDCLMNYAIFNTARSYKFVGKYGIFRIHRKDSASLVYSDSEEDIYNLYLTDVALDLTKDTVENKKILVHLILYLMSRKSLKYALNHSSYTKNLFKSCLDRIFNTTNISEEMLNEIRKRGKNLDFIDYPF